MADKKKIVKSAKAAAKKTRAAKVVTQDEAKKILKESPYKKTRSKKGTQKPPQRRADHKKKKAVKKAADRRAGNPTLYSAIYAEQAYELGLLGYTMEKLAAFFGVNVDTLYAWKEKHSKFSDAINNSRDRADGKVVNRLLQRAMGFEHDSEEIKVVSDGTGLGSSVERVKVRKIYPPDTAAAIFWLKNRQKDQWRDKVENGFTDKDGNDRGVEVIQLPTNGRTAANQAPEDNKTTGRLSDESTE